MKAMLVFPPSWTPAMPHLALPTLAAYLRARGVDVVLRDLNLEFVDAVLTRAHLEGVVGRLDERARPAGGKQQARSRDGRFAEWARAVGPQAAAQVEEAKGVMRSAAFYGERGAWALETIAQALELASLPYHPTRLALSGLSGAPAEDQSDALLRGLRDARRNPFLEPFREGILVDLHRERPDLVGISICSAAQMLAGLTLAALIKESGLPCHITVGGPYITLLREPLRRLLSLFRLIDSAVIFEGEQALLRLAEQLPRGDLSAVPNLIYREGDDVRQTPRGEPVPLAELPTPDFAGLPLARYLAPALVLPLASSRGCYHHCCAFCNVGYGEPHRFQQLEPAAVVSQMLELKAKHAPSHIWFMDEAITPRNLRGMSALLAERGAPVDWSAYVRFDRAITGDLLATMARGGCRTLFLGLESASPEVMRAMRKGIELDTVRRLLRDSSAVGLWNHLFLFLGFPGETMEDAQATLDFLYEERPYVHSLGMGTFALERYAPTLSEPERYGIERVTRDPKRDLAVTYGYRLRAGMDEPTARLAHARFLEALPPKPLGHLYTQDAHRILHAARLRAGGASYPPWLE